MHPIAVYSKHRRPLLQVLGALSCLWAQLYALASFVAPRLAFLACCFWCPLFIGSATPLLFIFVLSFGFSLSLVLAVLLPLPIAALVAFALFVEIIPE